MKYKLSDLVDVDRLQTLMDDFYQVTEAPTAILEADGTVLTATGWQPICTEFHRVCPELAARCTKSDIYIAEHLDEGEPYVVYECANGLVDVAAPIIVEGEHIGTVFTGQFLFEAPDVERFRKQAQEFGLDEEAYLAALAQVPIVSRERLDPLLTYLSNFAVMLADVGLEQLKSERLEKEMGESETKLRAIFSAMPDIVMVLDREGRYVEIAPTNPDLLYKPPNDLAGQLMHDVLPPAAADAYLEQIHRVLDSGESENFEYTLPVQSGEVTFFATITPLTEDRVVWVARDITDRKQAEAERERFTRRLSTAADIATQVNTILDPDELLQTVIPLIKERFGLYYVHVYTVDAESGTLNLRAGYGEAGEKMLAEGHRIPLDREASLVATAARTQEPVLVNDVTKNPNFMPNPLLPDTRAEVAVPAIAGDEVLGVFDVQHDEKNYFTAADLDAFRTLAGQIATAFRNARIFEAQTAAEAEARRNAAQRAALLNAIPDLMFRFDSDGTFLDYKAEVGSKLLAPPEVFLGHHVSEVLPPSLAEMTLEHLDQTLQTGEQVIYEYQAPVGDAMHYYEARMVPSGDDQVLALIRDITERKQAEEAIREREERLRSMAANVPGVVYQFQVTESGEMGIAYVSERAEDVFGLEPDIETFFPEFIAHMHEDDRERLISSIEEAIAAQSPWEFEGRFVKPSGDILWFNGVSTPTHQESRLIFNGLLLDITERRQAEERLRANEERLSLALESGRVGIWEFWPQRNEVYYNPTWYTMLGYEPNELPQELSTWGMLLHPDDAERANAIVQNGIQKGEDFHLQFRMKSKGGDWRWIQAHGYVTEYTPDGIAERTIGTHTDITERKLAEIEQERFTQRLDTAAQISEQVGSILDPDELLETVIPLIKEQFGLYYVHVYTLDEESGTLNLRAGYGEAGEKMLAEGHSIPLDREASLVARAARTQEPVLVDDVTENPHFMPNPLLPDTRTEVAVPAIAGGKVLGVFDVQHDESHYFTPADVDVFTTLAGQIANAFQSAELLGDAEEARDQAQRYLELVGSIIVAIDAEGKITLINRAGCELLGYEEEELIGQDWFAVSLPEVAQEEVRGVFAQIMAGDIAPVEEYDSPVVTREGEERILSWHNSLLRDDEGNILGTLSSAEDITERLRAEQAMRESQVKFQTVADYTYDWEYWLGPDGEFLYVSPACEKITGYSVAEFESNPHLLDEIVLADDEDTLHHHVHDYHQNPQEVPTAEGLAETEFRIKTKDGDVRWIGHACQPVYGPNGEWLGRRASNRDITEQKLAEIEQQRFTTRLNTAAQISEQVGSILDPDELLETVIPLIKERFGLYYVHVYTLDEESGMLNLRAGYGEAGEKMLAEGHSIPLDREASLVARAARTQDPVLVDDVTENPNFMPNPLLPDTKTEVAVPAIAGGKVLGVFDVQHDETHYFTQADVDVFQTLAGQIANAFQSAELFEQAERNLRETEVRLAVSQALAEAETESHVWSAMLEHSGLYPEAAIGLYAFEEEAGKKIQVTRAFNNYDTDIAEEPVGTRFPANEFEVTALVAGGEQVIIDDIFTDTRMGAGMQEDARKLGYVSLAATPISVGNTIIGLIVAHSPEKSYFDEAKLNLYATLAEQGAVALQAARLRDQLSLTQFSVDHGPAAIYWMRPDASLFDVNETACRMLGYSREELLSLERFTDLDPNFPPEAWAGHWEDLKEKQRMTIQTQHQAKDGTIVPVEVEVNYLKYGDQEFDCAFARDITERLEAERAVRESEERIRLLIESVRDYAIIQLDPEGRVVAWNEGAQRIKGYTEEEIVGAHFSRFYTEEDQEVGRPEEVLALARERGSYEDTGLRVRKDGSAFWANVVITAIRDEDGNLRGFSKVTRDITERMEAEERLRTNEERLSLALEAGRVGIWEFWPQKNEVYFNPTWYTMLGYEPDELPQELSTWGMLLHPDDAERANEIVMGGVEAGKDFHLQFRMKTKEGGWRWIQAHGYITEHTPEGSAERVIGTHTDITEQKLAQEELREAEAQQRAILETTPVGIAITSVPEGKVLYVNPEFTEILGYPEDEVMNQVAPNFYASQEEAEATLALLQSQNGKLSDHEIRAVRADGAEVWLSLSFQPLEYGGQPASLVVFVDITERRQTQAEVERFAGRLNTAAAISEQVGSILDPDELLETVIPLIKERFGLYYVHVYTLDEESGMLNLRAGYGEAGEKMLAEGHSIPLDREASLVATAARTQEPVLVDDVTENPNFMPNPLLPDTKTEVAIPSIAGGKVLGVFDVQHDEPHYFTDADVDVFQTLAAQIANAFRSAELFDRAERQRALYDGILQNLPIGVWAVDNEFTPLHINEAGQRMLGRETVEADGRRYVETYDVIEVESGEPYDNTELPLFKAVTQGGQHAVTDAGVRHTDGSVVPMLINAAPLFDPGGEQMGGVVVFSDMTEQRETQEAIREERNFSNSILGGLPGIFYLYDSEGKLVRWNENFQEVSGYSAEEMRAMPATAFIGEEDRELIANSMQQVFVEGQVEVEAILLTKDGEEIPYYFTGIRTVVGGEPYLAGVGIDITERKRAEEALQMTRSSVERSPDAFYWFDEEARFIDVNEATLEMTGYTREEILALSVFDIDPTFPREAWVPLKAQLQEEGAITFEGTNQTKDGISIPVEVVISYLEFGEQDIYFSIARDITERKQAQAERERFTTRLNTAAQISEQVGSILDPDELLETVIPLIKERFGLYYVHVYTLDEETDMLNLRAGYGEAGEKMLAEGHSIPLDREASLVATAARTQEPVLVDDVTENPNFMPNPLLPDTKTEVAVPSIAGGRVLGVFDVQHDESHYFTQADVDVFQTLAAQIANAFRTAELYETAEDERAFYDGIIENLPVGVWAVDNEFTPLLVNPAGREMMGREVQDQDGGAYVENYEVIDVETGELYDNTKLPLVKAVTQGGEHSATGIGVRHPDGTVVPQIINAAPLYDAEGKQRGGVVIFVDATEQYEAQQAIRENQIKFQTVADYTYDWEYWLGPDGEFLYVSPACEKITGYTVEEFMNNPNLLDEIVHPDDREPLHHHVHVYHENPAEVATAEEAAEVEFRIMTKDGDIRWIGHVCQPVYGPEGEWLGRRASNRDATEAVKARESLAQNEERLSLALESGRVGIWEFWPQRDEVYYNPTYYTMLGYEPYELPQDLSTWSGLMHSDDVDHANATVMDSIQNGEDFHLQFRMQTKEGDWLWIQAHGYVTEHTPEGIAERVIGTHTDITERKLAEAEQERLSAVLEATTDFVGIATPDGKGVYFNQAGREMVGIPADADPSEYEIVSFTPERELARTQEEILPTAIQEGSWTGESFIRPLDGEEIPVLMTVISITDEAGNLRYLANIARDITDIREAQEAQARFAAQLGTAAEIAARVNAVLDPDELFDMVIPLTKERFDLYHVHFYAFDPEGELLNLRAGYGRAGELMLRQGHKIPLDRERSIVARAARDRELIVVNDVTAAPNHLPNMLLPDTKSEVAVPAIVGDELLGVLDVQADEANFFSESDLDVYRTLVGQIATAYQNARYFERQHESEVALRESAEKIRAIFNAITDGISVTNMTGEITDLNEALLDLHGYQQRDELLGRNTMELIARDDWPTATQNINHTLDEGSSRNQEMLLVRKGGGLFDGELSTALLQDEEGNPTGIISVVRDITERKRREAALRLTRASVDNAEDEIFWFDQDGNFFDVNRAACEVLGYTREELLELQVFDIDPDFPEEAWPGLVSQLRDEGAVTLTSQHMTKSGEIFPVEVTINYMKFGDQEYIFSFAHDITERQRVEEERRRFTTQLRTAAEVAAQINAILDPQELLAEVVPMVQERFDLYHVHVYIIDEETGELVMRVGTGEAGRVMLEEGHRIALDRRRSLVARAARSKQPVLVNDVTQDPDFMPNPLLPDTKSEVAVPALAGDRVIGVFDVQDDEPNRFTESDLDVFATLASQIAIAFQNAQYFEEVQRTAERLREVDRLKGEFLANMSHELRTPLNSILGYTEVILMGIDGPLNDEMKEDIDAIHKNGKHLLRLINDILDLTKIEAGRLKLEQEEVYLSPLFDDVRTNNIGYFHKQKTDIDFRVQVLDEDMRVYADRVRLTQILNNLVSNAAKFTDEGFVEMRAYRDGDWACMEVEDTGIGIAEEDLDTVFERFRQVDGSNARRAEGTGLGLAITKHLVEMHGGYLEIHSEAGKGSIFAAYLPIYEPEAEATEENPAE